MMVQFYLTVYAVDNNNNESEKKSFTVITHNNLYLTDWHLYNDDYAAGVFYLETKKGILYKDITIDFDYDIFYGYDPLNITTSFKNKMKNSGSDTFTFNYSDVFSDNFERTTYLKVIVTDEYGLSNSFIQIIPGKPRVLYTNYYQSSSDLNSATYTYIKYMYSDYGIKFSKGQNKSSKIVSSANYERDRNYSSIRYKVPDSYSEWIDNYYESDYGHIWSPHNVKIDISLKDGSSGTIPLIDEFSQPITYDVKVLKEEDGYIFYKVTVSNRVRALDNPQSYATYLLQVKNQYVTFDGTETIVMTPVSDVVRLTDFKLMAADSLNLSAEVEKNKGDFSPLGWSFEGYSGLIRLINYDVKARRSTYGGNSEPDSRYVKYNNSNYSPDYIKILPPNVNNDTNSVRKLTAYIKSVDQYLVDYMGNNKAVFDSGDWNDNKIQINNPNVLIQDMVLTYEEIEQLEGINISYDESSIYGYQIPVSNLGDGSYVVFVKLEDQNGKINWGSCFYKRSKSENALTGNSFKLSGSTITVEILDEICRRVKVDYVNAGKWTEVGRAEIYKKCTNWRYESDPEKNTVILNKTASWMKIYCHDTPSSDAHLFGAYNDGSPRDTEVMPMEYLYHVPVYIYPNGSVVPSTNVGLKNIIEGKALSILCTQTALVQTFCSPVNYKENVEEWEYHTGSNCVLNPVVIPTGGGNYEIPVKDIPSGYYYCAIVRFADGTTMFSTIKKK